MNLCAGVPSKPLVAALLVFATLPAVGAFPSRAITCDEKVELGETVLELARILNRSPDVRRQDSVAQARAWVAARDIVVATAEGAHSLLTLLHRAEDVTMLYVAAAAMTPSPQPSPARTYEPSFFTEQFNVIASVVPPDVTRDALTPHQRHVVDVIALFEAMTPPPESYPRDLTPVARGLRDRIGELVGP